MSRTKAAAVYSFLSGFGIPAYASASVPSDAEFPYLTYDFVSASFGDGQNALTVNVWYRTDSEAVLNAKAEEISIAVGRGGRVVPCDGGAVWITKGSPFCQAVNANADDEKVKRRYINLNIEFLTND
jgi:hypothetical protein